MADLFRTAGFRGAIGLVSESVAVRADRRRGARFDRRYGVDTSGHIALGKLGISSSNVVYGVPYEPVTPSYFRRMVESVTLPPGTHVFVDLGSGKGRALMLAASYPFKRIVGVEFSPVLNQAAAKNIEQYLSVTGGPDIFELHEGDAAAYVFPAEPLAIFLYNPFSEPVLTQVLDHLSASIEANPRDLVVFYRTPQQARLLDALDYLRPVETRYGYRVYRHAGWA
jgi:SAM-dependent methyltransferase